MPARDVLAAVAVMVVWGMNFVVIDRGLAGVPPLVFVALRFSVVLLALPVVARPAAPLVRVLAVGVFMSLGQFGLLYTSLAVGMPPGLASLVLQAQTVITVGLAALLLAERTGESLPAESNGPRRPEAEALRVAVRGRTAPAAR